VHRARHARRRREHSLVGGGDIGVGSARGALDEAGGAGGGLQEGLSGLEEIRRRRFGGGGGGGGEEEARERDEGELK
jgi:hypothetical protein